MKTFKEFLTIKLNEGSMYDGIIGQLAHRNPQILADMPGSIFRKAGPTPEQKEGEMTAPHFEYERTVDMYRRLGGDGKKSVPYPGFPGFWLHPNGIVSPDQPQGTEHQPIFDPYADESFGTINPEVK